MNAALVVERPMGRKKKAPEASAPALASVKIGKVEHGWLQIVSSVEERNIAEILTEMVREPLRRRYKAALARLNEAEGGKG